MALIQIMQFLVDGLEAQGQACEPSGQNKLVQWLLAVAGLVLIIKLSNLNVELLTGLGVATTASIIRIDKLASFQKNSQWICPTNGFRATIPSLTLHRK